MERLDDNNHQPKPVETEHHLVPFDLKYRCGPKVSIRPDVYQAVRAHHPTPLPKMFDLPQET